MQIQKLSNNIDIKQHLKKLGVDGGGVKILSHKAKQHIISIKNLHVGAANILKQDALSIGADLAVPRGTVLAATPTVDCILIASQKELKILSKKELSQPFNLKTLAKELEKICKISKPKKIEIMGIVNANDDSFYSLSRFKDKKAIKQIIKMIEDGADIIDVGSVSSRPNALPVSEKEELERLEPILRAIKLENLQERVKFSIDSYTPQVISKALESGFQIINDITGFENDEISKLCAAYNATAIIMHMQGKPQTMQNNPTYENVLNDINIFFQKRVSKVEEFGVKNIILDIGIGFGKSLTDNLTLIKNLESFLTLNKPLMVGASRKSLIGNIDQSNVNDRLGGTLAIHLEAVNNGASILRVHDVYEHKQALLMKEVLDKIVN